MAFSQACENNKRPIFSVLESVFATVDNVLEIGGGTGQHAEFFAAQLPHCRWQSSDQAVYLPSLQQRLAQAKLPNLPPPLQLDVTQPWPVDRVSAIFSANTLHIMSWPMVQEFFAGIGRHLQAGGPCCIYGPFNYDGEYTSQSNADFDRMLRQRDPQSGLRDFAEVISEADQAGLQLEQDHAMPANNRLLVLRKAEA